MVGGGYVFDGENDYMRIGDDPSLGGDGTWSEISVEFWIKPTSEQKGGIILAKKDPANRIGSYVVGFRDSGTANTLFFGINNGTIVTNSTTGRVTYYRTDLFSDPETVLPVNEWSHVVCTYESGTGMAIYINGNLRASKDQSGNIAVAPGTSVQKAPLYIGYDGGTDQSCQSDGGMYRYRWLSATLDEVRVYNRALTSSQVVQRFSETRLGLSSSSTVKAAEMVTGQTWTVSVTPNDSYGDGVTRFNKCHNRRELDGHIPEWWGELGTWHRLHLNMDLDWQPRGGRQDRVAEGQYRQPSYLLQHRERWFIQLDHTPNADFGDRL